MPRKESGCQEKEEGGEGGEGEENMEEVEEDAISMRCRWQAQPFSFAPNTNHLGAKCLDINRLTCLITRIAFRPFTCLRLFHDSG